MGSYLNIHLSLFSFCVLLFLFTLSHGRPSTTGRKTLVPLPQSHTPQLRHWYHHNNLHHSADNVNSVNNEYTSASYPNSHPLSHDQQVSDVANSAEKLRKSSGSTAKATGREKMEKSNREYTTLMYGNGMENKIIPSRATRDEQKGKQFPSNSGVAAAISTTGDEQMDPAYAHLDGSAYDEKRPEIENDDDFIVANTLFQSLPVDEKHSYGKNASKLSAQGAPHMRDLAPLHAPEDELAVDFFGEDTENNELVGSQQQLVTFRQNILRSLGHEETRVEYHYNSINVTLNYNDEDSLAKYNITKTEYLQAYTEYITKVKQRRLTARGPTGAQSRRKNVASTKTYYDNGTDLFEIGNEMLKLFRVDIEYTPTMENSEVQIRRVVLPSACQLARSVKNSTQLPDLGELSNLSLMGNGQNGNETEGEQVTQVDLGGNVTAWSARRSTPSPFTVLAVCSRSESTSHKSTPIRHHHRTDRGTSMRVVTMEIVKPTLEAKLRRRARRSTQAEPSTLRSFTHKKSASGGRECANTRHGKTCCRRSLQIKFSDLGISDVILEPKEFDAHVCEGRCNARRVAYASTHAMFQHILHQTKGKKFAPRPCCVPTALTELDVLHLDPNGNRNGGPKLIVTILKDAIVKECGCS